MKAKDVFREFFTNLLKLENRAQAQAIALAAWPGTRDIWLHTMDLDPVLIELDLARVDSDGSVVYRPPDIGWTPWERETRVGDPRNPILVLEDGSKCAWSVVKHVARREQVAFEVDGSSSGITFYLGPDIFPDSMRLAWLTQEEKEGGPFMDRRVRSSEPDDFLSRIHHLASGSDEPFVPHY